MDPVTTLYNLLLNPNVAYLLLVLGLWALVAAATSPGTGVAEVAAAVFLGLAAVGLLQLPTNLVALVLIILAVALFVIDLQVTNHGAFTVGAVGSLLLGSLFLFRGETGVLAGGGLSPWVVVATILASAGYFAAALVVALRVRHMPLRMGAELVVGARGVAKTRIGPTGTALVAGELWTALASSPDEVIEPGEVVVVVALEGLKVRVTRLAAGALQPS